MFTTFTVGKVIKVRKQDLAEEKNAGNWEEVRDSDTLQSAAISLTIFFQ